MAEYVICDKEEITNIADTIRSATGSTEPMSLSEIGAGVKNLKPVQPDWLQNDETAQDYVKNRTHYESKEEISIEYEAENDLFLDNFPAFALGDTVTVKIDNMECSLTTSIDDGTVIIGDSLNNIWNETGEYGWQIWTEDGVVGFYSKENHTISYLGNVVHKIDKKFLPFDEFKMIAIWGYYEEGEFLSNLSFEEAYNLVSSNAGLVLGIYSELWYGDIFYLVHAYPDHDLSDGKTIDFLFKNLGGTDSVRFWYLEDGTFTTDNPLPK